MNRFEPGRLCLAGGGAQGKEQAERVRPVRMQVSAIVRQASGACVRGCRSWPIGLSCLARAGFCRYASGGRARARGRTSGGHGRSVREGALYRYRCCTVEHSLSHYLGLLVRPLAVPCPPFLKFPQVSRRVNTGAEVFTHTLERRCSTCSVSSYFEIHRQSFHFDTEDTGPAYTQVNVNVCL